MWDINYFETLQRRTWSTRYLPFIPFSTLFVLSTAPGGTTHRPCQWAPAFPGFLLGSSSEKLAGHGPHPRLIRVLPFRTVSGCCVLDLRSLLSRQPSLYYDHSSSIHQAEGDGRFAAPGLGLLHYHLSLHPPSYSPTSL